MCCVKDSICLSYTNQELCGWILVVLFHTQYPRPALSDRKLLSVLEHCFFSLWRNNYSWVVSSFGCCEILNIHTYIITLPLWDISTCKIWGLVLKENVSNPVSLKLFAYLSMYIKTCGRSGDLDLECGHILVKHSHVHPVMVSPLFPVF